MGKIQYDKEYFKKLSKSLQQNIKRRKNTQSQESLDNNNQKHNNNPINNGNTQSITEDRKI